MTVLQGEAVAFVLRGTKGLDKRQVAGLLNQKVSSQTDRPYAQVVATPLADITTL